MSGKRRKHSAPFNAIPDRAQRILKGRPRDFATYAELWRAARGKSQTQIRVSILANDKHLNCSEPTVKRSLARLVEDGLIYRVRTAGTWYTHLLDHPAYQETVHRIVDSQYAKDREIVPFPPAPGGSLTYRGITDQGSTYRGITRGITDDPWEGSPVISGYLSDSPNGERSVRYAEAEPPARSGGLIASSIAAASIIALGDAKRAKDQDQDQDQEPKSEAPAAPLVEDQVPSADPEVVAAALAKMREVVPRRATYAAERPGRTA